MRLCGKCILGCFIGNFDFSRDGRVDKWLMTKEISQFGNLRVSRIGEKRANQDGD